MAKAVSSGMPKLRIEEAAARRQAEIDSGREVIVGVNKFPVPADLKKDQQVEVLQIDNSQVLQEQVARLDQIRQSRDENRCRQALDKLAQLARKIKAEENQSASDASANDENLLALAVEAVRARASVGEVTWALEESWGRFQPNLKLVSGAYAESFSENNQEEEKEISAVRGQIAKFTERAGRPPRILVAKLGQDGHDRGQKVVASAFAELPLHTKRMKTEEQKYEAV
jgi:methylmalonyl-CoA mutase